MAESLASLFASGTETYVLQRMSELEKKMDVVNADYLQLSWRLCETLDENAKLSTRIADLEAKIDAVDTDTEVIDENAKLSVRIAELERKVDVLDTEYVQTSYLMWLSVKDTKMLSFKCGCATCCRVPGSISSNTTRPNMISKLINLERLVIHVPCKESIETISNSNVTLIDICCDYLPNMENFPSCSKLTILSNEITTSTLISTLSTYKHKIETLSIHFEHCREITKERKTLENYCKNKGISIVKYDY